MGRQGSEVNIQPQRKGQHAAAGARGSVEQQPAGWVRRPRGESSIQPHGDYGSSMGSSIGSSMDRIAARSGRGDKLLLPLRSHTTNVVKNARGRAMPQATRPPEMHRACTGPTHPCPYTAAPARAAHGNRLAGAPLEVVVVLLGHAAPPPATCNGQTQLDFLLKAGPVFPGMAGLHFWPCAHAAAMHPLLANSNGNSQAGALSRQQFHGTVTAGSQHGQ